MNEASKTQNRRLLTRFFGLMAAAILVLFVWQIASLLLQKAVLPTPITVFESFPRLFDKQIVKHMLVSLGRVLAGMFLAIMLGFLIGLVMGSSKRWNRLLDPLIYLTYPIPKMALLPIVMLLFGLGNASKIILIILIVFPQVVLAVRDAVRNIPEHLYDVYRCIRASRWQQFYHITLPSSMYAILSTSRVSLGTSISVLFFTENYGTEFGMGYFIMDAWLRMDYPAMYAAIILLSLMGLVLFLLIDAVGWYFMKWERE